MKIYHRTWWNDRGSSVDRTFEHFGLDVWGGFKSICATMERSICRWAGASSKSRSRVMKLLNLSDSSFSRNVASESNNKCRNWVSLSNSKSALCSENNKSRRQWLWHLGTSCTSMRSTNSGPSVLDADCDPKNQRMLIWNSWKQANSIAFHRIPKQNIKIKWKRIDYVMINLLRQLSVENSICVSICPEWFKDIVSINEYNFDKK